MLRKLILYAILLTQIIQIISFNHLFFDGNISNVDFHNYELIPLNQKLQKELDFAKKIQKDAVEVACIDLIRNSIISNNLNITTIMENSKVQKNLVFDKILVNTFKRCVKNVDFEKANSVLSTNLVTYFNSTDNEIVAVFPEEYAFNSNPPFNKEEIEILTLFYGENFFDNEGIAKANTITEKSRNSETDLFEIIDSPKNRQLLIGFSSVLILCYLLFTIFKGKEKAPETKPSFEKPKYYRKKHD